MRQILGNDYNLITNMIMNKYKEGINILEKKDELKELKIKYEKEKIKSEKLSNMNIELSRLNEKKEEENNNLKEKINELDKIKKKYNKYFGEEMKELEKYEIQNSKVNFEIDPNILAYGEKLASDRIKSGLLYNIDAYLGLEDKKGYLIYQNLDYDLIVKRIYDKAIIKTLKGHKNKIRVIRYYHNKNNKKKNEEYILSCDSNKLIIIWDINNNFGHKYSLQEKFNIDINDALMLFNIFNKDYIITSSGNYGNNDEYIKLYELKKNISFQAF
jgi:WD40 repeat protein